MICYTMSCSCRFYSSIRNLSASEGPDHQMEIDLSILSVLLCAKISSGDRHVDGRCGDDDNNNNNNADSRTKHSREETHRAEEKATLGVETEQQSAWR